MIQWPGALASPGHDVFDGLDDRPSFGALPMIFDSRQIATLILLSAGLVVVLSIGGSRRAVADLARQASNPKIVISVTLYLGWLVLIHWIALFLGLWNFRLIGESIFWVGASGFSVFVLAITEAGKKEAFFRGRLREALGLAAIFEFYLNVKTLPVYGELLIQALAIILILFRAATQRDSSRSALGRFLTAVLALIGLLLFAYTTVSTVSNWRGLDKVQELRKLFMTFWLLVGALPFLYLLALVAAYGQIFAMMKATTGRGRTSIRSRLGVLTGLRGRLTDVRTFEPAFSRMAAEASSWRRGYVATRLFKQRRAAEIAQKEARLSKLAQNAGVSGTDARGRQLDRREFEETERALRWVATVQMGRYEGNGNSYVPDVLDIIGEFERHGLARDHGVVVRVRRDGQAWYAYRRVVSGWVLAVGSRTAPPDQWFYDGPEPRKDFPANVQVGGDRPTNIPQTGPEKCRYPDFFPACLAFGVLNVPRAARLDLASWRCGRIFH